MAPEGANPASAPELRLPLSLGRAAIGSLLRGATALGLAGGAAAFAASPGGLPARGVAALAALLVGCYGAAQLTTAFHRRAIDALVGAGGLALEGGALHGLVLRWSEVDAQQTSLRVGAPEAGGMLGSLLRRARGEPFGGASEEAVLKLVLRAGSPAVLSLEGALEREALRALHDALRGIAGPPPAGARKAAAATGPFLRCRACGVPIAPQAVATLPCPACGTLVAIPEALRARVRSVAEAAVAGQPGDLLVRRLLAGPRAGSVNSFLALAGAILIPAVPASLALAAALAARGGRAGGVVALAGFAGLLVASAYFFLRAMLEERLALRLLALELGARAPEAEGEPAGCRACPAPLPEAGPSAIATCVYCGAESVVGFDPRQARRAAPASTLDGAVAAPLRNRQRLVAAGAGALLLLCAAAGGVVASL